MLFFGDKETNRYTDAVVNDIRSRIKTDFDVDYFGGSTYIPHDITTIRIDQRKPYVCINTKAKFTFDCVQYLLKNTDGAINTYRHDFVNTLPYVYGITAYVYYDGNTEDKAKKIEEQFCSKYADEVEVWVDIPNGSGVKSLVKLRVDKASITTQSILGGITQCKAIDFVAYYSVYFWQAYDVQNIEENPKQQFALLQATEFALLTYSKLTKDAIRRYEIDYNAVVVHKMAINFLLPKAYREVKERYDRGLPIDRTLFDAAFANIVNVYPQLYDYFMQGMSYEQIYNDMKNRAEFLAQRYVQLCDDLKLPESLKGDYDVVPNCRNLDSLQIILNKMANTDKSIDEIISEFLKELEDKRLFAIQREQERQERARMEAEYGYDAGYAPASNRGGGFLSNMLSTAGGVYLGEKMTDHRRKKEASKETQWRYMCSLSCPYRGKDYGPTKCKRDPRTCGHGRRY